MSVKVYTDSNCQTIAYQVISTDICVRGGFEVGLFCNNSVASVVNCDPLKWNILDGERVGDLQVVDSSTDCVPFAREAVGKGSLYANQKCEIDGWRQSGVNSLGDGVVQENIPDPGMGQSQTSNLSTIIAFGLFVLLIWYFLIKRAFKLRKTKISKSSEDGLEEISLSKPVYKEIDEPVIIQAAPLINSTSTLDETRICFQMEAEDTISTISSQKSWQNFSPAIPEPVVEPQPRPSLDPYKATPEFLPRQSTDSYCYNQLQPIYQSHFTSRLDPYQHLFSWNTDLVSSMNLISRYEDVINSCTFTFRSQIKFEQKYTGDSQKSFEKGMLIKACVNAVYGEMEELIVGFGQDRDKVFKSIDSCDPLSEYYQCWKSIQQRVIARLMVEWKLFAPSPVFVSKLELFVDRVVKFICMSYAVGANLIISDGQKFEQSRHTFEEGSGDVVYSLIPGLGRGEEVIFREIVAGIPAVDINSV